MRFVGVLVGTIMLAALGLVPAPGAEAAGRSTVPTTAQLASESPALRRYLLHAYLRQAAGEPLAPAIPARRAIAASVALLPVDQGAVAAKRWSTALNRHLSIVWPQAPLPLPPELEAREKSYTELGPGLWDDRFSDGRPRGLVWLSSWRNQHTVPLAMGDFKPKLAGPGAPPSAFECTLPRYAKPLPFGPGTDTSFLCRTSDTPDPAHPAYAVVVRRLTGREPATLEINALDLVGQPVTQRMFNRLEAQA